MVADIGATDRTLVVVAGAAGPDAGAPFSNARIRRPLVLVAPGKPKELGVVEAQVRPWDVAQTLVVYAGLDAMPQSEGVELLSYLTGRRKLSMWLSMLARDGEDWLQGVRTDEVAYIFERATEDEVLYDLTSDPDQQVDLSAEQTEAVAKARGLLSGDRTALDERLAEGPVADRLIDARLAALGYR
jgi:arylsulfatase A-like enzyme